MDDYQLHLQAKEVLKRSYKWLVVPDHDGCSARILEFPGCFGQGDTVQKAISSLERAALCWLMAALENNVKIPLPADFDLTPLPDKR